MLFLVGKISSITKSLKRKLFIYSPSNYSFSGFIAENYRALSHSWHHEIISPYQKISFFPCYSWLKAIRNPIWSLDNRSHSTGGGALRLSLAGVKGWWPFLPFCSQVQCHVDTWDYKKDNEICTSHLTIMPVCELHT